MPHRVVLANHARKEFEIIPTVQRERIIRALYALGENPYLGKPLKGKLSACRTWRAWPYRIVYQIIDKELVVLVVRIAHRQGAYQ